jgi:cytochrome P450
VRAARRALACVTSTELPRRREEGTPAVRVHAQQDPPKHTRLRKLVSKSFTLRAAEGWRACACDRRRTPRALERGQMT